MKKLITASLILIGVVLIIGLTQATATNNTLEATNNSLEDRVAALEDAIDRQPEEAGPEWTEQDAIRIVQQEAFE